MPSRLQPQSCRAKQAPGVCYHQVRHLSFDLLLCFLLLFSLFLPAASSSLESSLCLLFFLSFLDVSLLSLLLALPSDAGAGATAAGVAAAFAGAASSPSVRFRFFSVFLVSLPDLDAVAGVLALLPAGS